MVKIIIIESSLQKNIVDPLNDLLRSLKVQGHPVVKGLVYLSQISAQFFFTILSWCELNLVSNLIQIDFNQHFRIGI